MAFGLGTGKELDEAELSALTEAARAAQVREKAVELLSAAPSPGRSWWKSSPPALGTGKRSPSCGREAAEAGGRLAGGAGLSGRRAVCPHGGGALCCQGLRSRPHPGGALPPGGAAGLLGRRSGGAVRPGGGHRRLFAEEAAGGGALRPQGAPAGQPTLWPAGATAGRTSVPACAAMVRSRRNGRKNAADRRM